MLFITPFMHWRSGCQWPLFAKFFDASLYIYNLDDLRGTPEPNTVFRFVFIRIALYCILPALSVSKTKHLATYLTLVQKREREKSRRAIPSETQSPKE
jgi:hypothetical protein